MHNPEKVLLGSHGSSAIVADCEVGDPATFKAGLVVRRPTSSGLSLTSGSPIGISLGRSLSDHSKVAVARTGNLIPVLLDPEAEDFDFVVKGAYMEFDSNGKACESGTATQAFYVSGPIKGIDPITGEEFDCAIVDFPGGL